VIYRAFFKTVLQRLSPEAAHDLAAGTLRTVALIPAARTRLRRLTIPDDELIRVHALGQTFPSPLGVAAGLDKNAEWFDGLGAVGFGFVEVGTITPRGQQGNPPPTITRILKDKALLNRMGFPNDGALQAAAKLERRSGETIVGANIGKNRTTPLDAAQADYRAVTAKVAQFADYLVMNVSSPNTPGLRELQTSANLRPLIEGVQDELRQQRIEIPLLVKISPDMSDEDIDAVAELALELELDGIIATNTTVSRRGMRTTESELAWFEGGGVSGPPLKRRSLEVLRRLHTTTAGRLTLISVGGIETADDVWERITAGATLVQAYTGFIYGGPGWPRKVNMDLARKVWESGAGSIQDLVGTANKQAAQGSQSQSQPEQTQENP
jgi:dihydroorotate dehydrogenase